MILYIDHCAGPVPGPCAHAHAHRCIKVHMCTDGRTDGPTNLLPGHTHARTHAHPHHGTTQELRMKLLDELQVSVYSIMVYT